MTDLDKIRNMNDDDLKKFLKNMAKRETNACATCGKISTKVLKVTNNETFQTKILCGLCDRHYEEFLEQFKILPIMWNE